MSRPKSILIRLCKNNEILHTVEIPIKDFPNLSMQDFWEITAVVVYEDMSLGRLGPLPPWGSQ